MRSEQDLWKDVCLHCGVSVHYQPPKDSGCNHVHYPEACPVCSEKAAVIVKRVEYDVTKVMVRLP